MISLSKSGSTVTFDFDNNSGYLQNGTIEVPLNALSLVLDASDMATFKKANGDVFISALVSDFGKTKSELESWYKENMVGATGGGGQTYEEELKGVIDKSITSIDIPSGITSIGKYSFYYCSSLSSVTIPNTVTSIDTFAFNNCSSLRSIEIPNSVTTVGSSTFNNCTSLSAITIGSGVTSINFNAFSGVYVQSNNFINNSSLDAAANNYWGATLYDEKVDGMYIANNKVIKADTSITVANIPSGVTSVDTDAFAGCASLTSVTIPDTVTSIGVRGFRYCSSLTSVTIPSSVASIGNYAFAECTLLTSMICESSTPPTVTNSNFLQNSYKCKIYVPTSAVDTYKAASGWSNYAYLIYSIEDFGNLVVNGNFEGTTNNNFLYNVNGGSVQYCTIQDGIGKDDSRGISVTNETATEAFNTELFVKMNEILGLGTEFTVEFDYKANKAISGVSTQSHGQPTDYHYWACIGTLNFTDQWQHFTNTVTVTSNMAGNSNNFQTICFTLGATADATYYFDNFRITRI